MVVLSGEALDTSPELCQTSQMATYTKRGNKIRTQVRLNGVRESRTFDSITEAKAWALNLEAGALSDRRGDVPDKPFSALLERYGKDVSLTKKGHQWELAHLAALQRDPIARVSLRDMSGKHVAEWRDRRLAVVRGSSVCREWNLLSSVCAVAVAEWKWLHENPFAKAAGVKRPSESPHRDETITPDELAALRGATTRPAWRRVMRVVDFALETAMRSGEIIFLGLNTENVNPDTRVAHLPDTKNGSARDVPLSAEAVRIWNDAVADSVTSEVEGLSKYNVWGLTDETRDVHWRDLRDEVSRKHPGVSRLHFHDTRHTAITRLAKKLTVMELARMVGHHDINELLTYYNERAETIAQKL